MDVTKNFKRAIKRFNCGHCNTQSAYDIRFAQTEWDEAGWPDVTPGKAFVVVQCHNCQLLSIFNFDIRSEQSPTSFADEHELQGFLDKNPDILSYDWNPEDRLLCSTWMEYQGQYPSGRRISSTVPTEIRGVLNEASDCLAVGASNAAVLMSRCVVERLASHLDKDPGNKNRLADILREIRQKEMVSDGIFQALFEIKDWGNIVAHSKDRLLIDLKEARMVVDFVFQIVDGIFPTPSATLDDELKELRKLRQKKNP